MLERVTKLTDLIIIIIYRNVILLFFYKIWKRIIRLLYNSHEVVRLARANSRSNYPRVILRFDLYLQNSSKLQSCRRTIESILIPGAFESAFLELSVIKNFNSFSPESIYIRRLLSEVCTCYQLMHKLNTIAVTRYDSRNVIHERKLLGLWKLLRPNVILQDRYSFQWQDVGFQGKDPASDFRGMGILGLDDLYYFAETYPEETQKILPITTSFGITGISMTMYCLRLVRTRQVNWVFYQYGTTLEIYHEIYCYLLVKFNELWCLFERSVMDFQPVFKEFQVHSLIRRI